MPNPDRNAGIAQSLMKRIEKKLGTITESNCKQMIEMILMLDITQLRIIYSAQVKRSCVLEGSEVAARSDNVLRNPL